MLDYFPIILTEAAAKPEQAKSFEAGLSNLKGLKKTYLASALAYNDLIQSVHVTNNRRKTAMSIILNENKSPDHP